MKYRQIKKHEVLKCGDVWLDDELSIILKHGFVEITKYDSEILIWKNFDCRDGKRLCTTNADVLRKQNDKICES